MYIIGVVGPHISVERIIKLAKKLDQEMSFIPYPYTKTKETSSIVQKYNDHVDYWLFSGAIPYVHGKNALGSSDRLAYISSFETSLYKGLLDLSYAEKKLFKKISLDSTDSITTAGNTEDDTRHHLNSLLDEIYLKPFELDVDTQDLFQFHYKLWKSKKTEAALTCYPDVQEALQLAGVPAYWVSLSGLEIYHTLQVFIEKLRTNYFKDTQIGIEIIEFDSFDSITENANSPYHLQYLELRIKETLIKLCEKSDGSLLEQGNGRYTIFSSRGAIEHDIQLLHETIEYLSLQANTKVSVGIGYGKTAFSAEMNAYRALKQAKEKNDQRIIIVQDEDTTIEDFGSDDALLYTSREDNQELINQLKQGNIPLKTYKKIDALIKKEQWKSFTTKDLSLNLQMSNRNAQKIIADLCNIKLAECIGEETQPTRGRPSKIYRLIQG